MTGQLYLVGTPIGHLGDVSDRVRETLGRVSHIYAEDTRHTRVLLSHLGIEGKKLLSVHAHSTPKSLRTAVEILEEGHEVALVTDAGMPSISDPGTDLVCAAREAGIAISVVPGPSAVTCAIALSGLVSGPFTFLGFLPRKGRARAESLNFIAKSPLPLVLFESPHRIGKTLQDLAQACGGERKAALCRELTKRFEETRVGPLAELVEVDESLWRGEITLVVAQCPERAQGSEPATDLDEQLRLCFAEGESVRDATERVYRDLSLLGERPKRRQIYARALELAGESIEEDPSGESDDDSGADEDPSSSGG